GRAPRDQVTDLCLVVRVVEHEQQAALGGETPEQRYPLCPAIGYLGAAERTQHLGQRLGGIHRKVRGTAQLDVELAVRVVLADRVGDMYRQRALPDAARPAHHDDRYRALGLAGQQPPGLRDEVLAPGEVSGVGRQL